ncbi:MAG: hypothetical protein WA060_02325 [Minisyncoccia bacterium]
MGILEHLDKDNLHHAYLIEGVRDEVVPEIIKFCENINIKTSGNPDFCHISIDNFKIDEAFDLRAMSSNKSFSSEKRIFLVSINSFSLDAQNVLLKMFEEPVPDTHFFLIVPDVNALLKTLVSRFYLIAPEPGLGAEAKDALSRSPMGEAEKFIVMSVRERLDFIKELLTETAEEDEEGNEIVVTDSARSKALKFLNALETLLQNKFVNNFSSLLQPSAGTFPAQNSLQICFEHIFKVREFLRMPGSSTKSLMESVAVIIPSF